MPSKRPSVKNDKQYEALKDKGMSKQRAARIANSPIRRITAERVRAPAAMRGRVAPQRSTRQQGGRAAKPPPPSREAHWF